MTDEQQHESADPEQAAVGADAGVTNAAAADVEAALDEETLEDQAQDTGDAGEDEEASAGDGGASAEADEEAGAGDGGASAEADEDTGPDVEQDEEGVAEVKDHATKLLGADEDEGPLSRVGPGIPSGLDPGTAENRDVLPKPKS